MNNDLSTSKVVTYLVFSKVAHEYTFQKVAFLWQNRLRATVDIHLGHERNNLACHICKYMN